MECYTEFDAIQQALRQVKLNENVMPYVKGRLVENIDAYNKIQKLLNCKDLVNCHQYLYDLDIENLDAIDIEKIDKLFNVAVKRNLIDNSFEEEFQKEQNPDAIVPAEEPVIVQKKCPTFNTKIPCWTILYSATKDGETKCGECYSNAISVTAARADCQAKLVKFGYENIAILAIEASDPQSCDMYSTTQYNELEIQDPIIQETSKNPYAANSSFINTNEDEDKDEDEDETIELDTVETGTDTSAEEETSDEETSDEEETEEETSDEETSDEETSDDEETEEETSDDEETEEETSDDEDDDESEEDELDETTKNALKDEYRRVFKEIMIECEFIDKSFNDLTIEEKVKFFESLMKKWTKNEPNEFMSVKEQEQLESIVITL